MNIKNRTCYFYNDLINIKGFYTKLLKLDKKLHKNIDIYYTGYITKKDEYKIRINGFIEEKRGNKYLNIAFTGSNNEMLKNMQKFAVELKIKLR